MPTPTPEARLPLEPEEYPLYSPPKRIGCSALAILPILLIAVFLFLFLRVTPQLAQGMVNPIRQLVGVSVPTEVPQDPGSGGQGGIATVTAEAPTATPAPTAPSTPTPNTQPTPTTLPEEYVKVANTGGQGVRLRAEPKLDAARVDGLAEGTVCKIIGPDVKNDDGTWRNVEVVSKNEQGWVLSKWLAPASKP